MKRLKKAYIEITNSCNLTCNFCPKTKRKPRYITPAEFEIILQKVKPWVEFVYLHVMGEPLLHPQLNILLKRCEAYEMPVRITTNGTLLEKQKHTLLEARAINKLSISLHSFEANDGQQDLFTYLSDCASFCLEASQKTEIITSMRLWNMDDEELKGENQHNQEIFSLLQRIFGLSFSLSEALRQEPNVKLGKNCYLQMAKRFDWPDLKKKQIEQETFCRGLRDQIGFLADGTAVPCCLDHEGDLSLGNIFHQSIEEIYDGPRARRLFDSFSNRQAIEPLCRTCGFVKRFRSNTSGHTTE